MEFEEPDLATLQWLLPEFSQAFGPLNTPALALDYFSQSPFWDHQSNNGTLRTQFRLNPEFNYDREIQLLQDLPGTEFAVVHADPPSLFIIHKREGERGIKHRLLASYVILDSVIYQSPSVYDYASTKLLNAVHLISQTLETLQARYPAAEPRSTQLWQSLPPAPPPTFEKQQQAATDDPTTVKPADATASKAKDQVQSRHNPLLFQALFTANDTMPDLQSLAGPSTLPQQAQQQIPPPPLAIAKMRRKTKRTVIWSTAGVQNRAQTGAPSPLPAQSSGASPWAGDVDMGESVAGTKRKAGLVGE